MKRAETRIAQAKLSSRAIELLKRDGGSVRSTAQQVEKRRGFLGPGSSSASELQQRLLAFRQWLAPPVKGEPAPVRLELDT